MELLQYLKLWTLKAEATSLLANSDKHLSIYRNNLKKSDFYKAKQYEVKYYLFLYLFLHATRTLHKNKT